MVDIEITLPFDSKEEVEVWLEKLLLELKKLALAFNIWLLLFPRNHSFDDIEVVVSLVVGTSWVEVSENQSLGDIDDVGSRLLVVLSLIVGTSWVDVSEDQSLGDIDDVVSWQLVVVSLVVGTSWVDVSEDQSLGDIDEVSWLVVVVSLVVGTRSELVVDGVGPEVVSGKAGVIEFWVVVEGIVWVTVTDGFKGFQMGKISDLFTLKNGLW